MYVQLHCRKKCVKNKAYFLYLEPKIAYFLQLIKNIKNTLILIVSLFLTARKNNKT
jgi:hypothetical protein